MKLTKSLVALDLETTGTWVEKDKIIEIALIKINVDGKKDKYLKRVNPKISIPKEVCLLTGISDDDVKNAPIFNDIASEVIEFIGDSDFSGFNILKFDLPLLGRELMEVGLEFKWQEQKIYDSQIVYHINEKRDLTAAYQFYCGKSLENAHSAMADTEATVEILQEQIKKYGQGDDRVEPLGEFQYKVQPDFYDKDRKFRWWNGNLFMMFGKYARKFSLKEVVKKDRGYLEWIPVILEEVLKIMLNICFEDFLDQLECSNISKIDTF